ncbi:GNAT family N-acetyltransferase [Lysobacter sp. CCNWLW3]|uniref:GNAT family N-acetyltransferase n=2 Tax=Lysobacter TaxID=68 RepID=UPI002FD27518
MQFMVRPAHASDADEISGLITGWAHHYLEDPAPPEAGPFLATLTPSATAERIESPSFRYYVAEGTTGLCGVIALRERSPLYHLFVRSDSHGQGIARALWEQARSDSGSQTFVVNSSLPAIPVYERFGFVAKAEPQTKNGLVYVPMECAHGV